MSLYNNFVESSISRVYIHFLFEIAVLLIFLEVLLEKNARLDELPRALVCFFTFD